MVVGTTDVNVEVKGQCSSRAVLVSSVKGRITMFAKLRVLTSDFKARSLVFTRYEH